MGFIMDYSKRDWQAKCVYELLMDKARSCIVKSSQTLKVFNFENGRERGYTIKIGDLEVSWAENRNSDDIVVYPFEWTTVDEMGVKEFRVKSKYFNNQQFREVVNFILEYLGIDIIKGTVRQDGIN